MMLQPGVICPAVCFYDAGGYTLTNVQKMFFDLKTKERSCCGVRQLLFLLTVF